MEKYKGKINIYSLIEGAKKAEGLVVIIDVFRAFSLECYLYSYGAGLVRPVGKIDEAFNWKIKNSGCILVGEREGRMCEGFDFGNSPSSVDPKSVKDKIVIHTTSAGTQGVVNAVLADEIITGSLVNARAIAKYILMKNPDEVSLVCMGNGGIRPAKEDELCAEYIKSILIGEEMSDINSLAKGLQYDGGEHFFREELKDVFPDEDFWLCTKVNSFNFVLRINKDENGFYSEKIMME